MEVLTVDSAAASVNQVIDFVRSFSDAACGSAKLQKQLAVIVDEVYSNIASYAYAPNTGPVEVQVSAEEASHQLTVVFKDRGVPFNCLEASTPDTDSPVEERPVGGLGIFMVKEIADEVSYAWQDGCNVLTVRMRLE